MSEINIKINNLLVIARKERQLIYLIRFSLAGCLIRSGSAEAKNLLRCIPTYISNSA